jgi:hypothetical protein
LQTTLGILYRRLLKLTRRRRAQHKLERHNSLVRLHRALRLLLGHDIF